MKSLKENFFGNLGIGKKKAIENWLNKYKKHVARPIINDDLTINASIVSLSKYPDEELPEYIQFNTVE